MKLLRVTRAAARWAIRSVGVAALLVACAQQGSTPVGVSDGTSPAKECVPKQTCLDPATADAVRAAVKAAVGCSRSSCGPTPDPNIPLRRIITTAAEREQVAIGIAIMMRSQGVSEADVQQALKLTAAIRPAN